MSASVLARMPSVAVDARLLGERPQLLAVIGRNLRRQRLAHLQVLRQAVLVARPLQQPPRIVGELFITSAVRAAFWRPISSGVPADHQHRQVVDVLQFGVAGAAFLKDARFGRADHRAGQQKNRQQQTYANSAECGAFFCNP